ncbi:MAG TPA: hypothetical protein VL134_11115 [Leptolyngbya sp.]|nr:hypothetical protein [Leptolyngbya sp.]
MTSTASPVLDASALLAYLCDESGSDAVEDTLVQGSVISAINWAETRSKCIWATLDLEVTITLIR